MEELLAGLVAGLVAAFLTSIDLINTFKLSSNHRKGAKLYVMLFSWWLLCVIFNGGAAVLIYPYISTFELIKDLPWELRPIVVGFGYLTILNIKLDIKFPDWGPKFIDSIGIELFYKEIKNFVYEKINEINQDGLAHSITEYATQHTLEELERELQKSINFDMLITENQKSSRLEQVRTIAQAPQSSDDRKKEDLAYLIIIRKFKD